LGWGESSYVNNNIVKNVVHKKHQTKVKKRNENPKVKEGAEKV